MKWSECIDFFFYKLDQHLSFITVFFFACYVCLPSVHIKIQKNAIKDALQVQGQAL